MGWQQDVSLLSNYQDVSLFSIKELWNNVINYLQTYIKLLKFKK